MNYEQALSYIHSVNWCFCKPGLERITELTSKLGDPQNDLKFIHVAGTNGKGSFCSMLASVLEHAGYKTGLYTSPYITTFCERMCTALKPIPESTLADITSHVRPIADAMTDKPTEFELITAVALEYFKREKCDVVILEAGMGGRLDSTNVINTPVLSVITGIALDHTAYLGDTIEQIAKEKAGIIKNGVPVLYGGKDEEAYEVIKATAKEKGCSLFRTKHDGINIKNADLNGTRFDYEGYDDIDIALLGMYQPENAASVISAVDILRDGGYEISDAALRDGLADARWHARFELLSNDPVTIYDGAHNPQGIEMFIKSVRHYFKDKKAVLVSTVMQDKEYRSMIKDISEVCEYAYLFKINYRALDGNAHAKEYRECGVDATATESVREALELGIKKAREKGLPLVCAGSLYMYADLVKELKDLL